MRLVQRPPEPLDMRLTMSHITATFLGAESICPPLEVSDGIFSIQDTIRLSYGMTSSCQHYFLAHSALSPPCLCFPPVTRHSSQALPMAQAPTPLELFPAPVPAYIQFSGSWLLLRACQLLSRGLMLPSPWDTSLWIRVSLGGFFNQDGCPLSPWDQLTQAVLAVHWLVSLAEVPFIKVFSLVFHCPSQHSVLFSFISLLSLSTIHIIYPKEFFWAFSLHSNQPNSATTCIQLLHTYSFHQGWCSYPLTNFNQCDFLTFSSYPQFPRFPSPHPLQLYLTTKQNLVNTGSIPTSSLIFQLVLAAQQLQVWFYLCSWETCCYLF